MLYSWNTIHFFGGEIVNTQDSKSHAKERGGSDSL